MAQDETKTMNIHEARSNSLDVDKLVQFEKEVEQAAMDKVMDIHHCQSLKHSFTRFGQPTFVGTREDRLRQVLHAGLIAESFAKKTQIPISRNWNDPSNETNVSLSDTSIWLPWSFYIAVTSYRSNRTFNHEHPFSHKIPRENIYSILVENKPYAKKDEEERLARNRVNPRFFNGIVILDRGLPRNFNPDQSKYIDFESTSTQETVDIVVGKMKNVYMNRPNLNIPVYGLSGSLYWPRQMDYQGVQSFVGSRKS